MIRLSKLERDLLRSRNVSVPSAVSMLSPALGSGIVTNLFALLLMLVAILATIRAWKAKTA